MFMLLTRVVEVNWMYNNKKYYTLKGYNFTKYGDKFEVKVDDLPQHAKVKVFFVCDYCYDIKETTYHNYTVTNNDFIKKDACKKCCHKKEEEILQYKIKNKLISNENEKGYWMIFDNVIDQLDNFIKNNNRIGFKKDEELENKKWTKIKRALKFHGLTIDEALKLLGYRKEDLEQRKENGYYSYETILNLIKNFIHKYNRFPSQKEMAKDLKIQSMYYLRLGKDLQDIKRDLGYIDNETLIDQSGYINKSYYELVTANFLLSYNIPYLREQYPFKKFDKNLKYKSDFTFILENNEEIHVEIWGGMKVSKNQNSYFDYDEAMKIKIDLYNRYNIKLISISPIIFNGSAKSIKKKLFDIFNPILNLKHKNIKNDNLFCNIRLKTISDEELCTELMKYSSDENSLPTSNYLRTIGKEYLYWEVLKRYDSYVDFANKFNKTTKRKQNGYWTKENIFKAFDYMIENYGRILNVEEIKKNNSDTNIRNLADRIMANGGSNQLKLEYLKERIIIKNKPVSHHEIKFLHNVSNNKGTGIKNRITNSQIELANIILEKINC